MTIPSGTIAATENPKTVQGHLIPVFGHVNLEDLDASASHQKTAAAAGNAECGPLVCDAVYQFTFFADAGAGVIDSGVAAPDFRYVVSGATGATVDATSFPIPTSRVPVWEIHTLPIGSGTSRQTYVRFLNLSAAKAGIIGFRRLR